MCINIKKCSNFERFRCLIRSSSDPYEGQAILLCCGSVVRSSQVAYEFSLCYVGFPFIALSYDRLIIFFKLHHCPIRFYFVMQLTYIFMNTIVLSHLWLWDVQLGHSLIKLRVLAIRNSLPISAISLPKRNPVPFNISPLVDCSRRNRGCTANDRVWITGRFSSSRAIWCSRRLSWKHSSPGMPIR